MVSLNKNARIAPNAADDMNFRDQDSVNIRVVSIHLNPENANKHCVGRTLNA